MKSTILLLSSLLFLSEAEGVLDPRPVRIFHGLGDDCKNHYEIKENFKCVETGADIQSITKSIESQAIKGCLFLKSEIVTLKPGFYVIGFSQGGLIARWIQLHCKEIAPLIKRMVLVGTPNLGMNKLPSSEAFHQKVYSIEEVQKIIFNNKEYLKSIDVAKRRKIIKKLHEKTIPVDKPILNSIYDTGVKLANWMSPILKPFQFAPLNYFNKQNQYTPLIEDLSLANNNRSLNTLDFLVVIANRDERVVSPPESVTFGIKILDDKWNVIPQPKTSHFIKNNEMIRNLWRDKKMLTCLSDSSHSQLEITEFYWLINIVFSEDDNATDYKSSSEAVKNDFLKWYPNYCAFNNPDDTSFQNEYNETTNGLTGISNIKFALQRTLI